MLASMEATLPPKKASEPISPQENLYFIKKSDAAGDGNRVKGTRGGRLGQDNPRLLEKAGIGNTND